MVLLVKLAAGRYAETGKKRSRPEIMNRGPRTRFLHWRGRRDSNGYSALLVHSRFISVLRLWRSFATCRIAAIRRSPGYDLERSVWWESTGETRACLLLFLFRVRVSRFAGGDSPMSFSLDRIIPARPARARRAFNCTFVSSVDVKRDEIGKKWPIIIDKFDLADWL